jgi:hypothetical protein
MSSNWYCIVFVAHSMYIGCMQHVQVLAKSGHHSYGAHLQTFRLLALQPVRDDRFDFEKKMDRWVLLTHAFLMFSDNCLPVPGGRLPSIPILGVVRGSSGESLNRRARKRTGESHCYSTVLYSTTQAVSCSLGGERTPGKPVDLLGSP